MELEVTWEHVLRIWWALLWRGLLAALASVITSLILVVTLGFVLEFAGIPFHVMPFFSIPLGMCIGVLFALAPIKMILNKQFGKFKLVIIKNELNEGG